MMGQLSAGVTSGVCVYVCVCDRRASRRPVGGHPKVECRMLFESAAVLTQASQSTVPGAPSAPSFGCPGARLGGPGSWTMGPLEARPGLWLRPRQKAACAARNRSCWAQAPVGPRPGFGLGTRVFVELKGGGLHQESGPILELWGAGKKMDPHF